MRRWVMVSAVAVLAWAAGACTETILGVGGSGTAETETRTVSGFDSVVVRGSGTALIEVGPAASLTIEADNNLLQYLTSDVEGGALILSTERSINPKVPIVYSITVPSLTGVEVTGSGDVETASVDGERFEVSVSGSGNVDASDLDVASVTVAITGSGAVTLTGSTDALEVAISGSGDFAGSGLVAARADVGIAGSGDVVVNVSGALTGEIAGSGNIEYLGNPTVDISESGSGSVSKG